MARSCDETRLMENVANALALKARKQRQPNVAAYYEGVTRALSWINNDYKSNPVTHDALTRTKWKR